MRASLGHLEGIIYVGLDFGKLLAMGGYREESIVVLERSRAGLVRLDRIADAESVQSMLDQLRELGEGDDG